MLSSCGKIYNYTMYIFITAVLNMKASLQKIEFLGLVVLIHSEQIE
jgi:hypothetical protein